MRFEITGTALALGLAVCACGETTAEAPSTVTPPPAAEARAEAGPVLRDQPNLSETAEALPRLEGAGPGVARLNAELARLDAEAQKELADCSADGEWNRWVTRPMTGPGYVTLRIHTEISCGGPYPSSNQTPITWDLATGERLDWPRAVPGLSLTPNDFEDMPADYVPTLSSSRLAAWYSRKQLAAADRDMVGECADVWSTEALNGTSFKVWLDAQNNGVSVAPDFPHVIQACAETATLSLSELRDLRASQELVDAVAAAHAAGAWAPKEEAQP